MLLSPGPPEPHVQFSLLSECLILAAERSSPSITRREQQVKTRRPGSTLPRFRSAIVIHLYYRSMCVAVVSALGLTRGDIGSRCLPRDITDLRGRPAAPCHTAVS
ncbi:hypothetical protein DPEC_G00275560 [Dallia pectoralis]|uniref:Uncharacterized protein n=1 Tax=Dallia pectoralis TaxID=75939 RepID=A0ACC2FL93_DALPE|nr:hypothetical protein DPEC_G00275560 [Dallia pectoralis]